MKAAILIAAMAASFGANATVFGGDTTNNYDQRTTNQGGTGGQGGAGGNASAGAVAGAAVVGSGNSSNTVRNDVKNSVDNTNLNANNVSSRNENSNSQGQGQSQSSTNKQSQSNTSKNSIGATGSGNATSVSVGGDTVTYQAQERNPVSTAYAAPLAASNGTCMGSSSFGGQGASLGLSFGTTWTDSGCDARYDATALVQAGQAKAAIARLCLKAEIKQAMQDAGTPCPGATVGKTASADPVGDVIARVEYQDPIIRARLGLPPLK